MSCYFNLHNPPYKCFPIVKTHKNEYDGGTCGDPRIQYIQLKEFLNIVMDSTTMWLGT
jgi:hypothetical protein